MRLIASALTLLAGLVITSVSYLGGLYGPAVSFAPALFILGIMLLFISAVVYELTPNTE